MPESIKIVALESAHTHMNSLIRQTQELAGTEFVGFADPNPQHRAQTKERSELGDNMVFADYERLLDERQPDAAIICSTNADHVKYVEALAPRGIHIMLEKPFAASLSDADRMIAACEKHDVTLMVNWPTAWGPALRRAREITQSGVLGQVFQIAFRGGHMGPTADFDSWWYRPQDGGGVLLDYCCYAANVFTWILGKVPRQVCGMADTLVKPVKSEDNAVLLLRYDDALCVSQATWTRFGPEPIHGPVINGTTGSVTVIGRNQVKHCTQENPVGDIIDVPDLPEPHMQSGPAYFVHALLNGTAIESPCDAAFNRDGQEILEAGKIAVQTGVTVNLPILRA
jgi:predicted dehydrogenase